MYRDNWSDLSLRPKKYLKKFRYAEFIFQSDLMGFRTETDLTTDQFMFEDFFLRQSIQRKLYTTAEPVLNFLFICIYYSDLHSLNIEKEALA